MKQIITIIFLFVLTGTAFSQNDKIQTITIQSSIQCDMCVNNLNEMFAKFNPVKGVEYDIPAKTITVEYNSKKTSPKEIRNKINGAGYDADEQMADIDAYLQLDKCCQKGAHPVNEEKDEH